MKFKLLSILICSFLFCSKIYAQGQANNWYFGNNAGIDFNGGSPVAQNDGQINSNEGTAVMSDANGNLLFYTDGVTVWNRLHDTLSNGFGLLGGSSSTQSALIIPKPGSNSIYYIFTASQFEIASNWSLYYSELDINAAGGLGEITSNKNILLFTPVAEKLTAVRHSNNLDIWVIAHDKFTDKYLTYQVTTAGVNATPIIFNGGSIDNYSSGGIVSPNVGYLKASPDGTKIAAAFSFVSKVDVLDFNKSNGQLNYNFTINQIVSPYGVEFSLNSSLLYVSGYFFSVLRQYNLNLPTPASIISSSINIPIPTYPTPFSLQLGPDQKIYLSRAPAGYLDCIQHPDSLGISCGYQSNAVSLDGKTTQGGLPNFFPNFFIPPAINAFGNCSGDTVFFSTTLGVQVDSLIWNFGDPDSNVLNNSSLTNPIHIYENGGTYQVTLITYQGNQIDTLLTTANLFQSPNVSFPSDTSFCNGSFVQLNAGAGNSFIWQDGSNNQFYDVFLPGTYFVTASNFFCSSSDTINVNVIFPPSTFSLGSDVAFCEGSAVPLDVNQNNVSFIWQDGSTNSQYTITASGEYFVSVFNDCGISVDTILAIENPLPTVSLGADTTICLGNSIQLSAIGIADTYLWQDGSSNPQFTASQSGIYYVEVSNNCGIEADSINISVNPLPSVSLGQDISNCNGSAVQLNATGIADTYLWQDGSNLQTLTTNISGSYFVIVSNSCGTSSDTILVSINLPSTSFTNKNECAPFSLNAITYNTSGQFIQVLQNANGCDSVLTINATISNLNAQILQADSTLYLNSNPATIQWINCDTKALIAGANQATFVPQFTGSYAAIIADGICLDTSNCILVIKALPEPSPKLLCQGLTIFPNPINDKIEFILDKAFYPITIYTSTGALLKSSIGSQQKQTIFLENLAPAMYILQIDECRYKVIKN